MKMKKVKLMAVILSFAMLFSSGYSMTTLAADNNCAAAISQEETLKKSVGNKRLRGEDKDADDLVKEDLQIQNISTEFETKMKFAPKAGAVPEVVMNVGNNLKVSTLETDEVDSLGIVSNAQWSKPFDWTVEFELATSEPLGVYVGLFKDYENIVYYGYSKADSGLYNINLEQFIDGDGEYFFIIASIGADNEWKIEYIDSERINYKVPSKTLDTVKNVRVSYINGLFFDTVDGAALYEISTYVLEKGEYQYRWTTKTTEGKDYIYFDDSVENYIKIKARPEDINAYKPSESEFIKVVRSTYNPDKVVSSKMSDDTFGVFEVLTHNDEDVDFYSAYLYDVKNKTYFGGAGVFYYYHDTIYRVADLRSYFIKSGDYRLLIEGYADCGKRMDGYIDYEPIYEYMSDEVIHYTKPSRTLDKVKNASWDKYHNLEWDEVDNAEYYSVDIYKLDAENQYSFETGCSHLDGNMQRFFDIPLEGRYFAKIEAHANDIRTFAPSESGFIEIKEREYVNHKDTLTNLGWSKENPGVLVYNSDTSKNMLVYVDLYKDGVKIADDVYWNRINRDGTYSFDLRGYFTETGKYTYEVDVLVNHVIYANYVSDKPYDYVAPSKSLDKLSGVKVSKNGLIQWNAVNKAEEYEIMVYEKIGDEYTLDFRDVTEDPYDIINFWNTDNQQYVVIKALPSSINEYRVSVSDMIIPVPSDNNNGVVLQAGWSSTNPGYIECVFDKADDDMEYLAMVYNINDDYSKYGYMQNILDGGYSVWNNDRTQVSICLNERIDRSGDYVFAIAGRKYNHTFNCYEIAFTYCSDKIFNYEMPSKKINPVTNIKWNSDGIVAWEKNNDSALYILKIYEYNEGKSPKSWYERVLSGDENWIDISYYIKSFSKICIELVNIPKDITKYQKNTTGEVELNSTNYTTELLGNAASTSLEIIEQPCDCQGQIGTQATFHVGAKGEGLTYQWQFSIDKGYSWHDSGSTGAKTDTLSIEILEKRNGQMYRCVVTDKNGKQLTTEVAKIIVVAGKTFKINEQPKDYEGKVGEEATFHVGAQAEGLTYQWQFSIDKGYSWHDSGSTGAKTDTLSIEILEKRNGQMYRCVVTDKNGNKLTTEVAKIIVVAGKVFKINEQPKDYEGKVGEEATFHVGAQGDGLTYQWQFSIDKGYSWHDSGSTGAKTDTLSIEILEKRNGQMYRCIITDKNGNKLTTDVARIIVAATKNAVAEIEYQTLKVEEPTQMDLMIETAETVDVLEN